jgi:hypothetical protein
MDATCPGCAKEIELVYDHELNEASPRSIHVDKYERPPDQVEFVCPECGYKEIL